MTTRLEDLKKEIVTIFFVQKSVICITTLAIFVCSILIAFFWPPTYSATGSILIKGRKPESLSGIIGEMRPVVLKLTPDELYSEIQILRSYDVISRTIKYLEEQHVYFEKKRASFPKRVIRKIRACIKYLGEHLLPGKKTAPLIDDRIFEIDENLKVEILPLTNVLKVSYFDKDPNNAIVLLSALMEQYLIYRKQVFSPDEEEAFFYDQMKGYKKGLEEKEDELIVLVNETKTSDPQKEIENNLRVKNDLEITMQHLKNESTEKTLYIEFLEKTINSKDIEYFSFIENNDPITNYGISLRNLYVSWRDILRTYHPKSDHALSYEREVKEVSQAFKQEIITYRANQVNQLKGIFKKILDIQTRMLDIDERNAKLSEQYIISQRLHREIEFLKVSYAAFSKKREESKIDRMFDPSMSYISILSNAFPSDGPIFPKAKNVIPMGMFVGLIMGFCFAFVREYLDHTFKFPKDAETCVGLPVIFFIPLWEERPQSPAKTPRLLFTNFAAILSNFFYCTREFARKGLKRIKAFIFHGKSR